MIEVKRREKCCGCGTCSQICPKQAITLLPDEEGFLYPIVDEMKCVDCGLCEKACPEIDPVSLSQKSIVYACYRKNFEERLKSQSGGVFAVLAERVLCQGGIVYGAAYDENWGVHHVCINNKEQLSALLGSKYVQSETGNAFIKVYRYLKEGRQVLFSGTPCQIQGLKKYLGVEYDNLITVDLICHGVSSPKIWEQYLKEKFHGEKIERFVQKNKIKNNAVSFYVANDKVIVESYDKNEFSRGFSRNLFLRPACHFCSFRGIERCSDITLGDFWGIEKIKPEFYDSYGISAVLLHTEKGQEAFWDISKELEFMKCTADMLVIENPCLIESTPIGENRQLFFDEWKQGGVIKTVHELTKESLLQRILRNIGLGEAWILCLMHRIIRKMMY